MPFTIHTHNIMLNYEFRNVPINSFFGSNLYIGLSLSEIDNYGNRVLEPNDSSYGRLSVVRNNSNWSEHLNGESVLTTPLVFNKSSTEWGNIIELFISTDASINSLPNTILYHQRLNPLLYVGKNTRITIPANYIHITSRGRWNMPETKSSIANRLKYEFQNISYPSFGSGFNVRLSKSAISSNGEGLQEPSGGNYTPVFVARNYMTWNISEDGIVTNSVVVEFNRATESWGTITTVALCDSASNEIIYYQNLTPSITVKTGTKLIFSAGNLIFGRLEG